VRNRGSVTYLELSLALGRYRQVGKGKVRRQLDVRGDTQYVGQAEEFEAVIDTVDPVLQKVEQHVHSLHVGDGH
jgi:hypothetical protein